MGTTYISAPPTASLFVFSDDFNRANGALGSNWPFTPPTVAPGQTV